MPSGSTPGRPTATETATEAAPGTETGTGTGTGTGKETGTGTGHSGSADSPVTNSGDGAPGSAGPGTADPGDAHAASGVPETANPGSAEAGSASPGSAGAGSAAPGLAEPRERLRARLSAPAREWLNAALAAAEAAAEAAVAGRAPSHPAPGSAAGEAQAPPARTRLPAWELRFAAAGRHIGRDPGARARPGPAPASGPGARTDSAGRTDSDTRPGPATAPGPAAPADPTGPPESVGVTDPTGLSGAAGLTGLAGLTDPTDTARVLLLRAARATPGTLDRLYHQGTAAERRAVLLALPYLPGTGPEAVPLIEDALRANDTRLIAAAVGPYAARHLAPHAWRHAVLKCLFTEVPVAAVAGLAGRARGDAELARMLTDYARERTAAGRPVPPDLHHVLALTAPGTETETGTEPEPAATEPSPTEPAATEEP